MNKSVRLTALAIACYGAVGCSSKAPQPDLVQMATEEFRQQMLDVSIKSVAYLESSKRLIKASDPDTEWVNNVDNESTLNNRVSLGFLNGVWTGTFGNLLKEVEKRSGYKYFDLLRDERITSYQLSIPAENITLMELLYVAYTNVPNGQINLIIREDTKSIILNNKCELGDACDGLRKFTNATPRTPD